MIKMNIQQSSVVLYCSPSFVAILQASGDLGLPSDNGEKRSLPMLFVSQLTLT